MKSLTIFFMLTMLMALLLTLSASPAEDQKVYADHDHDEDAATETFTTSLRGTHRILAQTSRVTMTCDKYPRVCRAKGSPGPDCCKKKCVNVLTDRLNCGMCGKTCKYSETCCKGQFRVKKEALR
ncbi:hypothetical protein F0562_014383 [Nyssa sinensis]|uniref:Stigma-specific STIG1-like protein 1 n=1 Tax=Nyssa sinensis TaxID=561372 RepID=A0A5J4ZSJ6_9ASTE|nr:hypothetical protein F0562_014383 [Nyssa sinensis]